MKLVFDYLTKRISGLAEMSRTRAEALTLALVANGEPAELGASGALKLTLKKKDDLDAETPLFSTTLTIDDLHSASGSYRTTCDLITAGINALLRVGAGADLAEAEVFADVQFQSATGEPWISSMIFPLLVRNTAGRDDDQTPAPLASQNIIYKPLLVGLTGGGAAKLDGIDPAALPLGYALALFDDSAAGSPLRVFELVEGSDDESAPDVIRPDVYDDRVWKLRNPAGGTGAVDSVNGQTGPVVLTASDLGLGAVDNTTDAAKPVSTATQTALDLKAPLASPAFTGAPSLPTGTTGVTQAPGNNSTKVATTAYVDAAAVAAAVGLLDLKGNFSGSGNPSYPSGSKGDSYVCSVAGRIGGVSGKILGVGDFIVCLTDNAGGSEASVGTSWLVLETNVPGAISSLAVSLLAQTTASAFKGQLALENVDNTADTAKPVSTAQQTALDLKAPLASPAFTGAPSLPTGTTGITQAARDNSVKLATTEYVDSLFAIKAAADAALSIAGTLASVRLATTAALGSYVAVGTGVGATLEKSTNGALTIDGVMPSVNDRVIVKNETNLNTVRNGVYVVTVVGSGAAKWKLTRATDADTSAELLNRMSYVSEGAVNAGKTFIARSSGGGAITFGTTYIGFAEYKAAATDAGRAYIRSNGDTVTGDGSPLRPFGPLTGGQAAYNAGFKHFDCGADCDMGTIIVNQDEELYFRGAGKTSKVYVQGGNFNVTLWDSAGISMWIGCLLGGGGGGTGHGGDLVIHYGYCVLVGSSGADGDSGSGYHGYNAGTVTLHGPMAVSQQVRCVGGNGGDDGVGEDPYNGGNGGAVWIGPGVKFLPSAVGIGVEGGTGITGGSDGSAGTVHLQLCDTGPCTPNGTVTTVGAIVAGAPRGFESAETLAAIEVLQPRVGVAVLVDGTITVSDASVTASTIVILTRKTLGGVPNPLFTYSIDPGVGFTIYEDTGLDASEFSYQLIEPAL